MNWHYVAEGMQVGPVTDTQLAQLFHKGAINADTLIWREGLPDWIRLHDANLDFDRLLAEPPPLPPAPSSPLQPGQAICAECGGVFPEAETIRHGRLSICAGCKPAFLQKLSEGAKFNTGELQYAGFGVRFAAKLVDGLIVGIPCLAVFALAMLPMMRAAALHRNDAGSFAALAPMLLEFGFIFVQLGYQIYFLGRFGATPGKMVCKIIVVNPDGSRFGYGRAAARCLSEMVSGMTCYIGYLIVLFDAQRRALHDHICSTRVVYK